ncbi:YtxH domain-containing protein [Candidatus Saccharibacteria bacterium]|nr:MAG: YtxH domain-containing protein [Candidatus Saccharibacteria bacterium]
MFAAKKGDEGESTAKKIAIGAALSAVAGYVAGILTAPKSGKETREDIKDKASETYTAAEKELKKLHTELGDVIAEAGNKFSELRGKSKKSLDDAVTKGQKAKDKAREMLSSLHDGEAEDKDLKKAIAEATKAVENLRTYLKK